MLQYDKQKGEYWLKKVNETQEPLLVIITTHLLVENCIDFMIQKNCKNVKRILSNVNNWTFSMKLELIHEMSLIPTYLFNNIKKLNKIRNSFAHNLDTNLMQADLDFIDPHERLNLIDFKKKNVTSNPPTSKESINILFWIGILTFAEIHNLILKKNT